MRTKQLLAIGVPTLVLAAVLAGCSGQSGSTSAPAGQSASSQASVSTAPLVHLTGTFTGANDKKAAGTVSIDGHMITLTGFSSDQGPDLHLYLARGSSEADVTAGVEIAPVASDQASQTFTIPADVDVSQYTYLVEHCDKALAVFGYAALSK